MNRTFAEISGECRRLAQELVSRIVELESDGAEFPVEFEGKKWRVKVDEVDAKGDLIHP